ncbi:hypothetical protein MKX03_009547 [Papaver bracteatum]|nr:hypothetical protein MKX03_009547 [Papaver bracteatum]
MEVLIRRTADNIRSLLDDQARGVEDLSRSLNRITESMSAFVEAVLTTDSVFDLELLEGEVREDINSHMKKIIVLDDGEVCSVCLQDMNVGNHARVLNCWHVFHEKCALEWLYRKPNCPLCRHDIRKESIKRKRLTHHDEELEGKINTHRRRKT